MDNFDCNVFYSPLDGEVLDIEDCVDPIFAQSIVGAGVVLVPTSSKLYAPCPGEITIVANGKHGITIKNPDGYQVLMHIGIDTVEMEGEGFIVHKKVGDKVEVGDLLLEFDLENIKASGKNIQSPRVITNPSVKKLDFVRQGKVEVGDVIFKLCDRD